MQKAVSILVCAASLAFAHPDMRAVLQGSASSTSSSPLVLEQRGSGGGWLDGSASPRRVSAGSPANRATYLAYQTAH